MSEQNIQDNAYAALGNLIEKIIQTHSSVVGVEDLPIVKIVDKLLELGFANNASDIHIEPYEEATLIRFRIDGILHDILNIPSSLHEILSTRIKILARLRTDEHQAAQDGKLRFKLDGEKMDVRVSILPVTFGEKVVLRLLAERAQEYALKNLGFQSSDLTKIEHNIARPWGMILATGPTGSGKTTTLYGILKILNRRSVNIATIEDPVEYAMDNVNQTQVNAKTNLTFATGLRSIVRQDPDIIMVGEIRDEETAGIAVNAALTGHLVLSTLHTNDAATTLPRLIDMGVQPFLVASTINIAIAQRLVRKICPQCREQRAIDPNILNAAKQRLSEEILARFHLTEPNATIWYGKGCPVCQMSGYQGRIVIAEVMNMNDEIKALIMQQRNAGEISQKAHELGMTTMVEDGMQKIIDGITTIDEILRVAQQ